MFNIILKKLYILHKKYDDTVITLDDGHFEIMLGKASWNVVRFCRS